MLVKFKKDLFMQNIDILIILKTLAHLVQKPVGKIKF